MRPADFAYQQWYPIIQDDCLHLIQQYEQQKIACPKDDTYQGIAGIVPHAGWVFSGKLAFNIISCLKTKKEPDTIIIFGKHSNHPKDITSKRKNTIMISGEWETPLGQLSIDSELAKRIQKECSLSIETEEEYEFDNTIELQLPFIKYVFPNTKIVPLGIVETNNESLRIGSKVVNAARKIGRNIKLIGTTDMTHYGPGYGYTSQGIGEAAHQWVTTVNDKKMIDLFLSLQTTSIVSEAQQHKNCCCSIAIASMLSALQEMNIKQGLLLDYYTSYSIQPGLDFVGYAGVLY